MRCPFFPSATPHSIDIPLAPFPFPPITTLSPLTDRQQHNRHPPCHSSSPSHSPVIPVHVRRGPAEEWEAAEQLLNETQALTKAIKGGTFIWAFPVSSHGVRRGRGEEGGSQRVGRRGRGCLIKAIIHATFT